MTRIRRSLRAKRPAADPPGGPNRRRAAGGALAVTAAVDSETVTPVQLDAATVLSYLRTRSVVLCPVPRAVLMFCESERAHDSE